jgi:hypothetical protein
MKYDYICTECGAEHGDPADARLGFLVLCLDCAIGVELIAPPATTGFYDADPLLAA